MAKLYARLGAMGSSKSAQLLMVKHNYESQNKGVFVFTSELDNRSGIGRVTSRVGISSEAYAVKESDDLFQIIDNIVSSDFKTGKDGLSCILVDEVQFFSEEHIEQLAKIVDELGVPVICYGLKTDFMSRLFEGSKRLLELADSIEEIKTTCHFCNSKATQNLKTTGGKAVYEGEQIQIGDEEYFSVCRYHYYNPLLVKKDLKKALDKSIWLCYNNIV